MRSRDVYKYISAISSPSTDPKPTHELVKPAVKSKALLLQRLSLREDLEWLLRSRGI